jgi:hypothetical protein
MKVALCFIISYEHILNKEDIWKEWIEFNKDIINVYFYYKDYKKIKSQWIRDHTIPIKYIHETNYYHVIPAYLSVMSFALSHDIANNWFCMLTDSCCPIISPKRFRYMFYNYYYKSIMTWKPAWWNPSFCKRANLHLLPKELHLANDPWYILNREHVLQILCFVNKKKDITKTICSGDIANESLFAIILYCYKQLGLKGPVISAPTHITDWSRMTSPTSPHVFKEANEKDIKFIDSELNKNKYSMFIRKVAPEFPNDFLKKYIYEKTREDDNKLVLNEPNIFIYNKIKRCVYYFAPYMVVLFFSYMIYFLYKV